LRRKIVKIDWILTMPNTQNASTQALTATESTRSSVTRTFTPTKAGVRQDAATVSGRSSGVELFLKNIFVEVMMRDYVCDHSRAYLYYAESLKNNSFLAKECKSASGKALGNTTALMGGEPGNIGKGVEGIFCLRTNAKKPFARRPKKGKKKKSNKI
jgi:hypothetical protein